MFARFVQGGRSFASGIDHRLVKAEDHDALFALLNDAVAAS